MSRFTRLTRALMVLTMVALAAASAVPAAAVGASPSADIVRKPGLEKLALRLLNCNRTGGKIRRNGRCKARGSGRYSPRRKPLERHGPIGTKAAWPWAQTMAARKECAHSFDGHPDVPTRFREAGYGEGAWGENIACTWGYSTRDMVIWASRAFQAEMHSDGGHWRNLKSTAFRSVGIAIARSGTTSTIVFDFYGRRPRRH